MAVSKKKVSKKKVAKKRVSKKNIVKKLREDVNASGMDYIFGRPTKYEKRFANMAYKVCSLGATNKDLSELFEVSISTLFDWTKVHEDLRSAIDAGKKATNDLVRKSFLQRAVGYEHKDVHISAYMGEVIKTDIIKHYPPDTEACKFWLRNREPSEWSLDPEDGGDETPEPVEVHFHVAPAVSNVRITKGTKK